MTPTIFKSGNPHDGFIAMRGDQLIHIPSSVIQAVVSCLPLQELRRLLGEHGLDLCASKSLTGPASDRDDLALMMRAVADGRMWVAGVHGTNWTLGDRTIHNISRAPDGTPILTNELRKAIGGE